MLVIESLGAQGDGLARTPVGPVHVPFTLPGETVEASVENRRAELLALRQASPLRVAPACRHFGACGGCALQHMEEGAYRAWKRGKVVGALRARAVETEVEALEPCAPASRRRVTFVLRRVESGVLLGFNRALSHTIVPVEECPVAVPEIVTALGDLRRLADAVCNTAKPFRATVTATLSGLDVAFEKSGGLTDAGRRAATALAVEAGLARLAVDGETIVQPKKPVVAFGGVAVEIPPGGFLQAVAAAEEAMAALIAGHLAPARRVLDLFAGCGAFALRLARSAEVHAAEGDAAAVAALDRARRFASGLKPVTVERRDLFCRPFTTRELAAFGGLVFDPPRAGAEAQARQIARSNVPLVAAVSCNPATLARDLAILRDGGYAVRRVVPIDQFLWTPHVEAVALLEKQGKGDDQRPARRRSTKAGTTLLAGP